MSQILDKQNATESPYKHKWEIVIDADSPKGAMDAVWHCWQAWRDGCEPIGMSCPASMGDRVSSRVKKIQ